MRTTKWCSLALSTFLCGCGRDVEPVSDYFRAQEHYAAALNKEVGQPPEITVAAIPLLVWPVGWVIQGVNGLGPCQLPSPQKLPVVPLPSSDAEDSFTLSAQIPAAITNGIVSANVDAHFKDVVRLSYADVSGLAVSQADVDAVILDPNCNKILNTGSGDLPITLVRGQVLGRQTYTWLHSVGGAVGAKVAFIPAVDPVGFNVAANTGPNDPLVLTETAPTAHFYILKTYIRNKRVSSSPALGLSSRPTQTYEAVETPSSTLKAFQSGLIGGSTPMRRTPSGP